MADNEKRVVFVDRATGLHHICGLTDGNELALTAGPCQFAGRVIPFISLYRVTQHAAWYIEPLVPSSHRYHKHPNQA